MFVRQKERVEKVFPSSHLGQSSARPDGPPYFRDLFSYPYRPTGPGPSTNVRSFLLPFFLMGKVCYDTPYLPRDGGQIVTFRFIQALAESDDPVQCLEGFMGITRIFEWIAITNLCSLHSLRYHSVGFGIRSQNSQQSPIPYDMFQFPDVLGFLLPTPIQRQHSVVEELQRTGH